MRVYMDNITHQEESILIRPQEAMKIMGITKTTFYRWQETDPNFPKKTKKAMGKPLYKRSDVIAYTDSLFDEDK